METQTGTITYIRDSGGVQGRDEFTRTRMDDGSLVVQARTITQDTRVLRDVTHALGADHRPLSSHIVQWINGRRTGDGWFLADQGGVSVSTWMAAQGVIRQRIETPAWPAFIVPHAVVCDAFICARYDHDLGGRQAIAGGIRSSPLANGLTGPLGDLMTSVHLTRLVSEDITVPAGTFTADHFRIESGTGEVDDLWVRRSDLLLVRLRSDRLATTYELHQFA